jgi:hypothetical protein
MEKQQALNLQRHIIVLAICVLAAIFLFHFDCCRKLESWRAAFNLVGFIIAIRTVKEAVDMEVNE